MKAFAAGTSTSDRSIDRSIVACPFIVTAAMHEHDVNAPLGPQFCAAVGQ